MTMEYCPKCNIEVMPFLKTGQFKKIIDNYNVKKIRRCGLERQTQTWKSANKSIREAKTRGETPSRISSTGMREGESASKF